LVRHASFYNNTTYTGTEKSIDVGEVILFYFTICKVVWFFSKMAEPVKVEWIPAHLYHDVEAKVDVYFDSRVREGKNGRKIGFFRGREFCGKEFVPPEGYMQVVARIEGDELKKERDVSKLTIWDTQVAQLDKAVDFVDVARLAEELAED
jgi:ribosomal protein L24E